MKKRLILIIVTIIAGLIGIEVFARLTEKPDYYNMDYEIIYNEFESINQKLLFETKLYQIYASHYDEDSYVLFENKDELSIPESLQKGYILIGDIESNINSYWKANYTLEIKENKEQEQVKRYSSEETEIYYYKIDTMKLISNDKSINSSILEIFENNTLSINNFLKILDADHYLGTCEKTSNNEYTLYEYNTYNIKVKNDLKKIILGNKDLTL